MSLYTYKIIGRSNIGNLLKSYLDKDRRFKSIEDASANIIFLVGSKESNEQFDVKKYTNSKIIDVSTSKRLESSTPYNKVGMSNSIYAHPILTSKKDYKKASYFANPGCSAIGSITALAPIINIVKEDIILDVKFSKSSLTRNSSFNDKKDIMTVIYPFTHFHQLEVNHFFGNKRNIKMVPTMIDVPNGININIHAFKEKENTKSFYEEIKKFYKENSNILLSNERSFELKDVINTDKIGIFVKEEGSNILINVVLDNLTVGGALTAYMNALKIVGEEYE